MEEKCLTTGQMFGFGLVKPEAPTGHPHEDSLQGDGCAEGSHRQTGDSQSCRQDSNSGQQLKGQVPGSLPVRGQEAEQTARASCIC